MRFFFLSCHAYVKRVREEGGVGCKGNFFLEGGGEFGMNNETY